MAKDPAFLFYPSDFLTGTMFFSAEEVGIYIRLLCSQHQHGGVIDKQSFNAIAKESHNIRSKFVEVDAGFFNERLAEEMEKRAIKSTNISEAVLKVWESRKKEKMESHKNRKANAMGIEDENEDVIVNKDLIKEREEKFKNSIQPFVEKYGTELCNAFFYYWTEPNKSGTKMRFEQQATWEISRRLRTWANNNKSFSKNGTGKGKDMERLERILSINAEAKKSIENEYSND